MSAVHARSRMRAITTDAVPGMGRLEVILSLLRDEMPEAEIQMVLAFVVIAGSPGITMAALRHRLAYATSTNTRIVSALSVGGRDGSRRPGCDLIEVCSDAQDARRKVLRLTTKGRKLAGRLGTLLNTTI